MKENEFFSIELCKRFVSDNNLPIPILNDKDKFLFRYEGLNAYIDDDFTLKYFTNKNK